MHRTALASLIGAWQGGVKPADINLLTNCRGTTNRNGAISMNSLYGKRALEGGKFWIQVGFANIDEITNNLFVRRVKFILIEIVGTNLLLTARMETFPVGEVSGINNHIPTKDKLTGRGGKRQVVGCA
jgi:hypothetical protein